MRFLGDWTNTLIRGIFGCSHKYSFLLCVLCCWLVFLLCYNITCYILFPTPRRARCSFLFFEKWDMFGFSHSLLQNTLCCIVVASELSHISRHLTLNPRQQCRASTKPHQRYRRVKSDELNNKIVNNFSLHSWCLPYMRTERRSVKAGRVEPSNGVIHATKYTQSNPHKIRFI